MCWCVPPSCLFAITRLTLPLSGHVYLTVANCNCQCVLGQAVHATMHVGGEEEEEEVQVVTLKNARVQRDC